MDKIGILTISIGLIVSVIGIVISNLILVVLGPAVSIVLFIFSYIEISRKRKLFLPGKDKYETVLSIKQKHPINKKHILSVFFYLIIAIAVFFIVWFLVTNYLYTPSPLSTENIINAGCRELNEGTGKCEKDPSTIIVNYDVNGDEVTGGEGDTLVALLKKQNCADECIRKRCGCLD